MKNNIAYYRHEVNSHTHWKFKTLRRKFGWAGEGKFWALNNIIANAENCKLDLSDINKKNEHACDIDLSLDEFNNFIEFLANSAKLIIKEGEIIFTQMTQDVLEEVQKKRGYQKEWAKSKNKTAGNEGTKAKAIGTESEKFNSCDKSFEVGKNIENKKSNIENKKSNIENEQSKVKEKKEKERLNYIDEKSSEDVKDDYIGKIILNFKNLYSDLKEETYRIHDGKDRAAAGKILSFFKAHYKEQNIKRTSEETIEDMNSLFTQILKVKNGYYSTNCTLAIISSKINEIMLQIKNGSLNGNSNANSTSTRFSNSSAEARATQQNKAKTEQNFRDSSRY